MSGKWIAYLPAFSALGLDLWYLCRTIFSYVPRDFAQYERPEDCVIFSIKNETFINIIYPDGKLNKSMEHEVTYQARKDVETDVSTHAKFCDDPAFLKFIPLAAAGALIFFFFFIVFRAQHYWKNYRDRVDEDEVMMRLSQYHEESHQVVKQASQTYGYARTMQLVPARDSDSDSSSSSSSSRSSGASNSCCGLSRHPETLDPATATAAAAWQSQPRT